MGQETTATATPDTPALISLLSGVIKELSAAKRFSEQLDFLRTRYEDSAEGVGEGYAEMLSALFAAGVGLAISLSASLEEVPDMVAQACKAATERDFDREKRSLKRPQRPYYDAFARHLTAMLNSTSEAIGAVIECYLSGNYDPDANPNDLILEALYSADADLEQARALLAQAGSIALHGSPLWWRWHVEATGPLSLWVIAISELIHGYTHTDKNKLRDITPPLSLVFPLSQIEGAGSISAVLEKRMGRSRPVAELIEALIEQGATDYTEEQLAACEAHRAEVIPALIELATDAYLQWEDSPGEGYAPIKAVEILGRLKATEAITALIDIVADSDPEAIIYSTAINALEEIGPPALEPILDFMRYSWNTWAKIGLGEVVDRIGSEDAEAFQVLVSVWEEADWEDGKCLLAWPLIRTGGEQAIPLLQEALKDPELGELDYGEIAAALRELGVEPPSFEERTPTRSPAEWEAFGYTILSQMTTPSYISAVLADVPPELQAKPEELVHIYTFMQCRMWASMLISTVVLAPAEAQVPLLNGFLDALDAAALPPAPKEFPVWMRKVYNLIPRELDSQIKPYLEGILLPLLHYAEEDYDIAEEPDQLLAQARELPPDDESLSALFGKAGALVLHGRQCWPLWPQESDPPLSIWLEGLLDLSAALKKVGQIPFHPPMEKSRQEELTANILDTVLKGTKDVHTSAPPPVQELLQELVECKQSTLPPARRRAFARHQAALVPYLIELVEDIRYWYKEGPGEGWAAILAIKLLGEFRAAQAANTLVKAVAGSEPEDIIHDTALFSLTAIGSQVFPAVRAYIRYGRNTQTKTSLAEVIGQIGRRERDAFDLLRSIWEHATWPQNRRSVALAFGDLKDRRAIPLLQAALSDSKADALDLDYVRWALEQLGVKTPSPQERPSHINLPAPHNPRLIYEGDTERILRLRYTPWGEPLCPDCGSPLVLHESGEWIHLQQRSTARSAAPATPRAKRRRRKRR